MAGMGLTPAQKRTLDAIRLAIEKDPRGPTIKELAEALGLSRQTVSDGLQQLQMAGMLVLEPRKWRGIKHVAPETERRRMVPQPIDEAPGRIFRRKIFAILCYTGKYTYLHGYAPTYPEVGKAFGVSQTTVFMHMESLERMGYIRRKHREFRSVEIIYPFRTSITDEREWLAWIDREIEDVVKHPRQRRSNLAPWEVWLAEFRAGRAK